jgi:aminoglycoside phosphotransferase (APT) family kinase protein
MSVAHSADERLGAPRPEHLIDTARLETCLSGAIAGFKGPLQLRQYAGGQSNPTYQLITPQKRYVLRKKPPGKLLESAHAIDREYRIMAALDPLGLPVAKPRVYCDDASIIGTPFYVMDHLDGRVFRDPRLPDLSAEERSAIYRDMVEVLAKLHAVDPEKAGLGDYGRIGGYAERQLKRWTGQYRDSGLTDIASMEFLIEWLPAHLPSEPETTIAHGDFRLENLVIHATEPRVIGILDWELSTLGDPLADLAYNCMVYRMSIPMQPGFEGRVPDGIPSEADYVETYRALTGRSVGPEAWRFYMAFSLFRLAAISAGIYIRGKRGSATSSDAHEFLDHARTIADAGARAARGD